MPGSLFSCLLFVAAVGLAKHSQPEQIGQAEALLLGARLKRSALLRVHSKRGDLRPTIRLPESWHGLGRIRSQVTDRRKGSSNNLPQHRPRLGGQHLGEGGQAQ